MMKQFPTQMFGIAITASVLTLTGCGGGGGSGSANLNDPASPKVSLDVNSQTSIPVQPTDGYLYPNQTSTYTARMVAQVRGSDGNLATGGEVQFNLSASDNRIGAIYETDFETTETVVGPDGEEFDVPAAFVNLPVEVGGGNAQALFQAHTRTGSAEVCASFTDPDTGATGRDCVTFDVTSSASSGLPADIAAELTNMPIFINGQNRSNQANIRATILDPAGQPVRNPDNNRNIQARIIGSDLGGARLTGAENQRGQVVQARTVGNTGMTDIGIQAGSESGTLRVALTADGADNNVENGIDEPVETEMTVAISDGRVASISFGSPFIEAIRNNETNMPIGDGEFFKSGTYSRVVSVVVQDARGNPVPGETVRFGLVDSPLGDSTTPSNVVFSPAPPTQETQDRIFRIAGTRGNPVEGGNTFTQNDNVNLISSGVGIADRLILHPDERGTEREMLGSRLIAGNIQQNSVRVTEPFVTPEVPGYTDAANIPWVIGRAQYGNIGTTATTNADGVASTFVTYPNARINHPAIITAQAENRVSSVTGIFYAGIADFKLTSSVTEAPKNASTPVQMCVADEQNAPVPNQSIAAGVAGGISISGSTTTGAGGCANFTLNVPADTTVSSVPFSITGSDAEQIEISIVDTNITAYFAIDVDNAAEEAAVSVTLVDENGNPVGNRTVEMNFEIDGDNASIVGSTSFVSSTNQNGVATNTVAFSGAQAGDSMTVEIRSGDLSESRDFPVGN